MESISKNEKIEYATCPIDDKFYNYVTNKIDKLCEKKKFDSSTGIIKVIHSFEGKVFIENLVDSVYSYYSIDKKNLKEYGKSKVFFINPNLECRYIVGLLATMFCDYYFNYLEGDLDKIVNCYYSTINRYSLSDDNHYTKLIHIKNLKAAEIFLNKVSYVKKANLFDRPPESEYRHLTSYCGLDSDTVLRKYYHLPKSYFNEYVPVTDGLNYEQVDFNDQKLKVLRLH